MNTLELLVVIVILGITCAFGIPYFHASIQNHQLHEAAQQYQQLFRYAHQQAILRDDTLTLCGTSQVNRCDGQWHAGAVLFIDNENKKMPTAKAILKTLPALSSKLTIAVSAFPSSHYFRFDPAGLLGTSNGSITLSNGRRTVKLSISRSGRVKLSHSSS